MRILFFVIFFSGIIYAHEIPFLLRFVKKTIYCYYKKTDNSEIDEKSAYLLERACSYWNDYFNQIGYKVSITKQGNYYDILVIWQPLDKYVYGSTRMLGTIGYCNNLPIPNKVRIWLNQKHLPDSSFSNFCKFDLTENYFMPPGSISLISIIQHEMGHALGLGHSNYTSSIMYPPQCGERRKDVTEYDGEALIELYEQECGRVCVGDHFPENNSTNIPVNTKIKITFTRPMEKISTENAISINPDFEKIFIKNQNLI